MRVTFFSTTAAIAVAFLLIDQFLLPAYAEMSTCTIPHTSFNRNISLDSPYSHSVPLQPFFFSLFLNFMDNPLSSSNSAFWTRPLIVGESIKRSSSDWKER
jgi:hypothetical protein